jgi:hypothetical protein
MLQGLRIKNFIDNAYKMFEGHGIFPHEALNSPRVEHIGWDCQPMVQTFIPGLTGYTPAPMK